MSRVVSEALHRSASNAHRVAGFLVSQGRPARPEGNALHQLSADRPSLMPLVLAEDSTNTFPRKDHWTFWMGLLCLVGVVVCAIAGIAVMKHRDVARSRRPQQAEPRRTVTELVRTTRGVRESALVLSPSLNSTDTRASVSRAPSALRSASISSVNALAEPPAVWRKSSRKTTTRSSFSASSNPRASFSASEAARLEDPPKQRTTRVTFAELPSSFASEVAEAKRTLEEALQQELPRPSLQQQRRSLVVENSGVAGDIARALESTDMAKSIEQDADFNKEAARRSSLSNWWGEDSNAAANNDDDEDGGHPKVVRRQKTVTDWYGEGEEMNHNVSRHTEVFDMETSGKGRKTIVPDAPPTFRFNSADSLELPSDVVADALDEIQRKSISSYSDML